MKFREDFVTNSSSSSFLLARKAELTKEQKDRIVSWVEQTFFGNKLAGPEDKEKWNEIATEKYLSEDEREKGQQYLEQGYSIWSGRVSYDEAEYQLMRLYEEAWDFAESKGEFEILDGDLSY